MHRWHCGISPISIQLCQDVSGSIFRSRFALLCLVCVSCLKFVSLPFPLVAWNQSLFFLLSFVVASCHFSVLNLSAADSSKRAIMFLILMKKHPLRLSLLNLHRFPHPHLLPPPGHLPRPLPSLPKLPPPHHHLPCRRLVGRVFLLLPRLCLQLLAILVRPLPFLLHPLFSSSLSFRFLFSRTATPHLSFCSSR